RYLINECQRLFRVSMKLSFGGGGGAASPVGSGAGALRGKSGAGASHGYSPANRITLDSRAYSRRYRCPSFFCMQIENPGYLADCVLVEKSTSLRITGAYPFKLRSICAVS